MAETAPVPDSFITVRSTLPRLPLPLISERPLVKTERLLIRPLAASDLEALHELRTQPEVMFWTSAGKPDSSLDEAKAKLDYFLSPEGNNKSLNRYDPIIPKSVRHLVLFVVTVVTLPALQ